MHPLSAKAGSGVPPPAPKETITLEIQRIRRDGSTQGRVSLNQSVVEEYAELMRAGTEFPPVRIWFDGDNSWLSDGFHRLAAMELLEISIITAEVFSGSLEDAMWDGYSANAAHGLRRTSADIEVVIRRALTHPKGLQMSNLEIARHLHIPETTVRRWRNRMVASAPGTAIRVAVRNGRPYQIHTENIGRHTRLHGPRSIADCRKAIKEVRALASPRAAGVFSMLDKWLTGDISTMVWLEGVELVVEENARSGA
jgi:hypothetical protein